MSYTVSQLVTNKIEILRLNILQRTKEQNNKKGRGQQKSSSSVSLPRGVFLVDIWQTK